MMDNLEQSINKQRIADSFSKAASTYDSVAALQRDIGHKVLAALPETFSESCVVCDLGCGTGYFTELLANKFTQANLTGSAGALAADDQISRVIALDLAHGMLTHARQVHDLPSVQWVCGDAEQLPLASKSIHYLFSSLAIQWCQNYPVLFQEIERVLVSGGEAHIATLGPNTLNELREAWAAVDSFTHVNQFTPLANLQTALISVPLLTCEAKVANTVLSYTELKQLTHELKALGAHNMNAGQSKGLTAPQRLKAFKNAYEQQRNTEGFLPATYEVYYLTLRKQ